MHYITIHEQTHYSRVCSFRSFNGFLFCILCNCPGDTWRLYNFVSRWYDVVLTLRARCIWAQRYKDFFLKNQFNNNKKDNWFSLYHSLGIFSRRQIDDIFLIFLRKQDTTFHANCLPRRQFAWNVISCFLRKIRKIFQNVVCWKFYPEC